MPRRTLADFIRQGFHARDKATCDQIIRDAEAAAEEEDNNHDEPDGDEGDVHVHVHRDAKDSDDKRLSKLEDSVTRIDKTLTRLGDALTKLTGKDDGLPEALKKHQFGKKDDDSEETEDAVEGGAPSATPELGAQSAEALTAAEPDLMDADPALKTGKSMMGDAAYVAAVSTATAKLFHDTAMRAAVLSPGLKMPTLDAVARGTATQEALCAFRRRSLTQALSSDLGHVAVGQMHNPDTIQGLSCEEARKLFKDASEKMREINNARGYVVNQAALQTTDIRSYRSAMAQKLAGINNSNREFWAKQTGRMH